MRELILGLDLGTRTGAAILTAEGEAEWTGTIDCDLHRYEDEAFRFVRFRAGLSDVLGTWKPEVVAFEEVARHAGTRAAHVYGGMFAMLAVLCKERGFKFIGIPVQTVKRTATGKGNADKAAVLAAAGRRWPARAGITEDEADALWVAETYRRTMRHAL